MRFRDTHRVWHPSMRCWKNSVLLCVDTHRSLEPNIIRENTEEETMSSDERMAILKMLSEGKVSVDEAEKLLKALGDDSPSGEPSRRHTGRDRRHTGRDRRPERPQANELGDLMDEIGTEVRKAVKSVQASEIGKVVSQEVNKAVGSLQRMDVGRMVGEIVEQVRDAVSEVVEGSSDRNVVEEQEWTLDGVGLVSVQAETTSGQVKLEGTDGDQVTVRAVKKVRARSEEDAQAFAREVAVYAVREGDAVRVYKEHPKPPKGVNVDIGYEIECPRTVDVDLRTTNGNVRCAGIEGAVQTQSTNGNVHVDDCRGRIEARTRNGNAKGTLDELLKEGLFTTTNGNVSVRLRVGQAPLTATTTNGNVEVAVPGDFAGRLDSKTTNGGVHCDLELSHVEQQKRNLLVGQLGAGGEAEVRLHTLNGNVRLQKIQEEEEGE